MYLGDALDHWKGSLFEFLAGEGVLRDFAIDPMASDLPEWTEADYTLYARLLRIDVSRVLRHRESLDDRLRYFAELFHQGDLFLDPDTGIATGRVQNPAQYLYPRDIGALLDGSNDRLLAVYQHVRAQNVSRRVDECLLRLVSETGSFGWCSYESGTVAMLFLSRAGRRTGEVEKTFNAFLGRHATGRIRGGVRNR